MAFFGFIIAACLFFHYKHRLQHYRRRHRLEDDMHVESTGPASCQAAWQEQWAEKFRRQAERRMRHMEKHAQRHLRRLDREARRFGFSVMPPDRTNDEANPATSAAPASDGDVLKRARRRAGAEVAFYMHLMSYLGVI